MERLLNADEVAHLLGLQKSTIYKLSHRGEIPTVKIGSALRFDLDEIETWLADKKQDAGPGEERESE